MSRPLTPGSSLENLRKEAKRWLKALHANDPQARERLAQAYPTAPAAPGLRAIQHALAREHGLESWTALKKALADLESAQQGRTERVARFLENACPTWNTGGGSALTSARHTAERLLKRYPEIARDSLYTAVVCGEREEVERILAEQPEAASQPGGPKGWAPLLYLSFARLSLPAVADNAEEIARALLDCGADPNAFFMIGGSRHTPLVGVIGEGEENRSPHPRRDELTRLLLERGAEPYDIQVLYNLQFRGEMLWFLELIYARSVALGREADWADPAWPMLGMGGYGSGARFLQWVAVSKENLRLAEWLLEHGASPNAPPPSSPNLPQRSLYEEALHRGNPPMAELLARHGAVRHPVVLEGREVFTAACLRSDWEMVRTLLQQHPEYLCEPRPLHTAAQRDQVELAAFLLDLGVSPEVEDPAAGNQRPLHEAASSDSLGVAQLLIHRGAEVDPRESNFDGTPLGFAIYGQKARMIDLLGRYSRSIGSLAFTGNVARLRELLSTEPELAKGVNDEGFTPLMWLPDDEALALEVVELLLAYGADPTLRDKQGRTAADRAAARGMDEVAAVLRARE